ncbi:hypothetical protein V8C86DRAFT_1837043 [Haematococcus lacustris]
MGPVATAGLAIQHSPEKGRHMVTCREFRAGELVLACPPYAAVLNEAATALRCGHCYSAASQLLRCGRSKVARYCSRACQQAAWVGGYQQECRALVQAAPRVPPPSLRLLARLAWRAARERSAQQGAVQQAADPGLGSVQWPGQWDSWRAVQGLQHHWQRLTASTRSTHTQLAAAARGWWWCGPWEGERGGDGLPSLRCLAHCLARLVCNAHTICDEEQQPQGLGLYPLAAMANHSCRPSCVHGFVGSTICFRALRDLAAGEEVSIAYIELGATRQQRREALADTYHFDINAAQPPDPHSLRPPPLLGLVMGVRAGVEGRGGWGAHLGGGGGGVTPGHEQQQQQQGGVAISVAGLDPSPPWPCDPPDRQLTQLLWRPLPPRPPPLGHGAKSGVGCDSENDRVWGHTCDSQWVELDGGAEVGELGGGELARSAAAAASPGLPGEGGRTAGRGVG